VTEIVPWGFLTGAVVGVGSGTGEGAGLAVGVEVSISPSATNRLDLRRIIDSVMIGVSARRKIAKYHRLPWPCFQPA